MAYGLPTQFPTYNPRLGLEGVAVCPTMSTARPARSRVYADEDVQLLLMRRACTHLRIFFTVAY